MFSKVIHQISRSHGLKNRQFESNSRLLGRSQQSNPSDLPCFKVKHYFGHISGMVGPIDVKQKGSASVGYWVQYVTLTFDLTHDLDLGCFKVKFRNSCISGIVGLIDVK